MSSTLVVTHERLGTWARQLRPRLASSGTVRWAETRSAADLDRAIRGVISPLVVIDIGDRPRAMLEDLETAVQAAPAGFFLVLDLMCHAGLPSLAKELGSTLVVSGWIQPPRIADILLRWLPLARSRSDFQGWSTPVDVDPEPWERGDPFAPARTQAIHHARAV